MRFTPPPILITITSLTAMAVTAVFLTLTMSQAENSGDPSQRYDRLTAPECAGFGMPSFVGAESLEDLLSKADVVIKGSVADRYIASGTHRRNLGYDIEVKKVLVGDTTGSTVTLAFNFAEVCLAPGDYEYYFFMARTEGPAPGSAIINNPAEFSLDWHGPQNVFPVEAGLIDDGGGLGMDRYAGMTERSFEDAVQEAASQGE